MIVVPIYEKMSLHESLLREFAAKEGVAIVDLPAVLPDRFVRPRPAYFFDEVHPTPDGHRLIAKAVFEIVAPIVP